MTEIELVFDKMMENVVRESFGDDVVECENGRYIVKLHLPVNHWLYGFILSFGVGVEVVHPTYLRTIIREIAEGIRERYSD